MVTTSARLPEKGMFETLLFEIVVIAVLIMANGFFAASEIAVVAARTGRLAQQAQVRRCGAAAAMELAETPNRSLAMVQSAWGAATSV